jgi:hypothetical protein
MTLRNIDVPLGEFIMEVPPNKPSSALAPEPVLQSPIVVVQERLAATGDVDLDRHPKAGEEAGQMLSYWAAKWERCHSRAYQHPHRAKAMAVAKKFLARWGPANSVLIVRHLFEGMNGAVRPGNYETLTTFMSTGAAWAQEIVLNDYKSRGSARRPITENHEMPDALKAALRASSGAS